MSDMKNYAVFLPCRIEKGVLEHERTVHFHVGRAEWSTFMSASMCWYADGRTAHTEVLESGEVREGYATISTFGRRWVRYWFGHTTGPQKVDDSDALLEQLVLGEVLARPAEPGVLKLRLYHADSHDAFREDEVDDAIARLVQRGDIEQGVDGVLRPKRNGRQVRVSDLAWMQGTPLESVLEEIEREWGTESPAYVGVLRVENVEGRGRVRLDLRFPLQQVRT